MTSPAPADYPSFPADIVATAGFLFMSIQWLQTRMAWIMTLKDVSAVTGSRFHSAAWADWVLPSERHPLPASSYRTHVPHLEGLHLDSLGPENPRTGGHYALWPRPFGSYDQCEGKATIFFAQGPTCPISGTMEQGTWGQCCSVLWGCVPWPYGAHRDGKSRLDSQSPTCC